MTERADTGSSAVGISDLARWIQQHWLLIGLPAVVAVVFGISYVSVADPWYKVEAVLAPADSGGSATGLERLAGQLGGQGLLGLAPLGGSGDVDVALAILRSRHFLGQFVSRHELLPKLFPSKWDSSAAKWSVEGHEIPSVNDAVKRLKDDLLIVSKDELSGLVTVSLKWTDGTVASEWLDALIADINEDIRERERAEATKILKFLRQELAKTELTDVRQALNELSLAQLQKLTLTNVREEFAFIVVDPPIAPDIDDPIWPKPALVLLGSASMGLFLGFVLAGISTVWRASRL